VTVLMVESDLSLVRHLYAFTSDALRASGTGRSEDVDAWKSKTYASHFVDVLKTSRPHATGRLGAQVRSSLHSAVLETVPTATTSGDNAGNPGKALRPDSNAANALRAFYKIYLRDGEARVVDYDMLKSAGYDIRKNNRIAVARDLYHIHKLIVRSAPGKYTLTAEGIAEARRVTAHAP
jgi:hypothetical protein